MSFLCQEARALQKEVKGAPWPLRVSLAASATIMLVIWKAGSEGG